MVRDILTLGNLLLRKKCSEVNGFSDVKLKEEIIDLEDTLDDFRKKNGFGRGIAASQVGILKRFIALNLGNGTFVMINPRIISRSEELFTLWDDCMSFPDLLVKIQRSKLINLEYQDEEGNIKNWNNIEQAESELLQHEIDHLDGILAIDKVLEGNDIIYKTEFIKNREFYETKVDYLIKSTI
jgi:peptide deformylase